MAGVAVRRLKLGSQGLEVSAQGLGCGGMSHGYGPPKPEDGMIKVVQHAINSGVTFLDTSDFYGPHINEILIGKALKGGMRLKVELATKFGLRRVDDKTDICGDPAYVRAACEASLKRLDIDCIDLYYQHRIDTRIPIEVTMGELKKLVEEGKIKYVGLSEVCASTIRRAHAVHPLTAVQLEWSLWTRDVEEEIVPTCRELGIGIVPYSPLGRGFFATGSKVIENLSDIDHRKECGHKLLRGYGTRTYVLVLSADLRTSHPRNGHKYYVMSVNLLLLEPEVQSLGGPRTWMQNAYVEANSEDLLNIRDLWGMSTPSLQSGGSFLQNRQSVETLQICKLPGGYLYRYPSHWHGCCFQ